MSETKRAEGHPDDDKTGHTHFAHPDEVFSLDAYIDLVAIALVPVWVGNNKFANANLTEPGDQNAAIMGLVAQRIFERLTNTGYASSAGLILKENVAFMMCANGIEGMAIALGDGAAIQFGVPYDEGKDEDGDNVSDKDDPNRRTH